VRILHLYRPSLPGVRAQAVQVVHTCHALARRGHEVTLFCDAVDGQPLADGTEALASFALDPVPGLHLEIAPTSWRPGASLWFRVKVRAWVTQALQAPAEAAPSLVYLREPRYAAMIPHQVPLVVEAHDCLAEIAREAGEDPKPVYQGEAALYERAHAVVANSGGTLATLESLYPGLPQFRRVVHNGTRLDRAVQRTPAAVPLVGYTGSSAKLLGLDTVLASMERWPAGASLEVVGGVPGEVPATVNVVPAVPYGQLPEWLARYHALLLPLDTSVRSRIFTSPLKLWDYLATGIPIVAADVPSIREIGGDVLHYYSPGDPVSLAAAVTEALQAGASPRRVRTWDHRAAEIERLLQVVLRGEA
jgi:glycosyltransferase involved in cell wall biosynthesis